MDVRRDARCASAIERTNPMADKRRCIGSARFGIEAHEAPITEFPAQPSQKDGLGRMCKTHWNAYTDALRKASIARKAAEAEAETAEPEPVPAKAKCRGKAASEAEGDAA
jgi:hypothetical protein